MSFALTVLGTSGMFATADRACSGYLLDVGGSRLLIDAGAGTWRNLQGRMSFEEVDAVLLTHRHPDHTTDLFQLYHARWLAKPEPMPPIPLWAPEETLARLRGFEPDMGEAFDTKPIAAGESIGFGGADLCFVRMAHPAETVGVRVEYQNRVFAFSADSGEGADFAALAKDADVFLCEATLQDSDPVWEGHLRASQAAGLAASTGARRLLLTHLPPARDHELSLLEATRAGHGVKVELATDGAQLDI